MHILYSRPLGGLNDTFCQIQRAWEFAQASGRTMALDTRESGIMVSFTDLFEFLDDSVPIIWDPSAEQVAEWNALVVSPPPLQGKVAEFFGTPWPDRFSLVPNLGHAVKLPHFQTEAEIVIHHQEGGGNHSQKLLKQLRVKSEITQWIREQLHGLPNRYSAVHVRATDYSTNTQWLFRKVKRRLGNQSVVVCSDNPEVLEDARLIFSERQLILLPHADLIPAGSPIHKPSEYRSYEGKLLATKHLLRDIAVMTGATDFYFTYIDQPGKFGEPRLSGFTSLVKFLVDHQEVRQSFLGLERVTSAQRSVLISPVKGYLDTRVWKIYSRSKRYLRYLQEIIGFTRRALLLKFRGD